MDIELFKEFSEAEQAYAISLLDPFHDNPYRLTGAPSDQSTDSVVMTVNQELTVGAADFGLPTIAGSKWDLHVSAVPLLRASNSYLVRHLESNLFGGSGSTESEYQVLYPICASANSTGGTTFTDVSTTKGITSDLVYFSSNSFGSTTWRDLRTLRVIGVSFEVVDETPQLYKQGSVTVYNRASSETDNRLVTFDLNAASGPSVGTTYVDTFNCPPNRIQQATIIQNSKTWMAEKGAYMVVRPTTVAPPFFRPGITNFLGLNPTDPQDNGSYNCWLGREGINAQLQPGPEYSNDVNMVLPYNTCGAYFTGLSGEYGVYRIRSKVNYEIIPDPSDTALISLSTPTIPRNPRFEKVLYDLIAKLPVAYQQVDNPSGEVWRVIRKVARQTRSIVNFLDPAIRPLVSSTPESLAAYTLARTALDQVADSKKKKKPKSKTAPGTQTQRQMPMKKK